MADEQVIETLEQPAITQPVETQPDYFMQGMREVFDGLDENASRESVVEHFNELQRAADEAERLREENARFQEMLATRLQEQQPAKPPVETVQEERKRLYEAAQEVDPRLRSYLNAQFVSQDSLGNYVPLVDVERNINHRFDPNVTAACNAMNASLEKQRNVLDSFTRDPYAFGNEVISHSSVVTDLRKEMAAIKAEREAEKKEWEAKYAPLQQHTQEQKLYALVNTNATLLTQADPTSVTGNKWTVAGEQFSRLIKPVTEGGAGIAPEQALEMVKPLAGLKQPAPPKQKPQSTKLINRLVPHLNRNGAVRNPELATRTTNDTLPWRYELDQMGPAITVNDN